MSMPQRQYVASAERCIFTILMFYQNIMMQLTCYPVLWLAEELNIERERPQS